MCVCVYVMRETESESGEEREWSGERDGGRDGKKGY